MSHGLSGGNFCKMDASSNSCHININIDGSKSVNIQDISSTKSSPVFKPTSCRRKLDSDPGFEKEKSPEVVCLDSSDDSLPYVPVPKRKKRRKLWSLLHPSLQDSEGDSDSNTSTLPDIPDIPDSAEEKGKQMSYFPDFILQKKLLQRLNIL